MFTRTRYQNGSLRVKKRGNGLRVWELRYYEPLPGGNGRGLRAVTVGTLQDYPTEASARKSDTVQAIILRINAEHTLGPVTASTVAALIARYEKEEMPARYSTRASYQSYLDNYIRPRWGEAAIARVRAMAVEDWLKRLTLAPKTRGHIRSLMSTLFKCAQRWELVENNPMQLVRVRNVSKRLERPSVLTAEEFHKVLPHVREPYRTMVLIAGCLGLRASEIVGLQWKDFDFEKSTLLGATWRCSRACGRCEDGVFTRCCADRPGAGERAVGVSGALLPDQGGLVICQSCDGEAVPSGGNSEEAYSGGGKSGGHHVPGRLEDVQAQLSLVA